MDKLFAVYMLASKRNGTLYTGITSHLPARLWQHRNKALDGFTRKYNVTRLVVVEWFGSAEAAIIREKEIKGWRREKKIRLIESGNPGWRDISGDYLKGRTKDGVRPPPPRHPESPTG